MVETRALNILQSATPGIFYATYSCFGRVVSHNERTVLSAHASPLTLIGAMNKPLGWADSIVQNLHFAFRE